MLGASVLPQPAGVGQRLLSEARDGLQVEVLNHRGRYSVLAVTARGSMYDPSAVFYMSKLVTGPAAADVVDIEAPVAHNVGKVAKAKGCSPQDVTVVILDRPRHADLVSEVRAAGARIQLITDGDVAGAIMAARDGTGVDLLLGVGGTPEGIIAACAIKCLGGTIQGRLEPRDRRPAGAGGRRIRARMYGAGRWPASGSRRPRWSSPG